MRPLCVTVRVLVLVLVIAAVGACSQSLAQNSGKKGTAAVVANAPREAHAATVFAVVTEIDHQSGVLVLDSTIGQLLTVATPAQLHSFHVGDVVLVHLSTENLQTVIPDDVMEI